MATAHCMTAPGQHCQSHTFPRQACGLDKTESGDDWEEGGGGFYKTDDGEAWEEGLHKMEGRED